MNFYFSFLLAYGQKRNQIASAKVVSNTMVTKLGVGYNEFALVGAVISIWQIRNQMM